MKLIYGKIPYLLQGIYYKNGINPLYTYKSLIDGEGYIQMYIFNKGKIQYNAKHVETDDLYIRKNGIGTVFKNKNTLSLKNFSNTNVVFFNNTLYSLYENNPAYILDPITLKTLNKTRYNYSSHAKVNNTLNILQSIYGGIHTLEYSSIDTHNNENLYKIITPHRYYIHDFIIQEIQKEFHFIANTFNIDILHFITGEKSALESLQLKNKMYFMTYDFEKNTIKYNYQLDIKGSSLHAINANDNFIAFINDNFQFNMLNNTLPYESTSYNINRNENKQICNLKGEMPKYLHNSLYYIHNYSLIKYDILQNKKIMYNFKNSIDSIYFIEEPCITESYILSTVHSTNYTFLYIFTHNLHNICILRCDKKLPSFHNIFVKI